MRENLLRPFGYGMLFWDAFIREVCWCVLLRVMKYRIALDNVQSA